MKGLGLGFSCKLYNVAGWGNRRNKNRFCEEAIVKYLDDMADIYIALARLEKSEKRWSLDDLESRFLNVAWI